MPHIYYTTFIIAYFHRKSFPFSTFYGAPRTQKCLSTAFPSVMSTVFTAYPQGNRKNPPVFLQKFSQTFPLFSANLHRVVEKKKAFHFFFFYSPLFPNGKNAANTSEKRVAGLFHCFHRPYYYFYYFFIYLLFIYPFIRLGGCVYLCSFSLFFNFVVIFFYFFITY